MISNFAIAEIRKLQKDGLNPSAEEIIRLNAIGLRCAAGANAAEFRQIPRTAYLGRLVLREPTLGHGEWIDRLLYAIDATDAATVIIAIAYALARDVADLPDVADAKECVRKITAFARFDLRHFTLAQVRAAVDYALVGTDHTAREMPTDAPEPDNESVHVGILWQTVSLGLGLTVADIRKMTPAEIAFVHDRAFERQGIDVAKASKTARLGKFYDELARIRERLEKEREEANG